MAVHLVYSERNWQEVWALNTSDHSGGKTDNGPKLGMTSSMISRGAHGARGQYQRCTALPSCYCHDIQRRRRILVQKSIFHIAGIKLTLVWTAAVNIRTSWSLDSSQNGFSFVLMTETKHGGCQLFLSLSITTLWLFVPNSTQTLFQSNLTWTQNLHC